MHRMPFPIKSPQSSSIEGGGDHDPPILPTWAPPHDINLLPPAFGRQIMQGPMPPPPPPIIIHGVGPLNHGWQENCLPSAPLQDQSFRPPQADITRQRGCARPMPDILSSHLGSGLLELLFKEHLESQQQACSGNSGTDIPGVWISGDIDFGIHNLACLPGTSPSAEWLPPTARTLLQQCSCREFVIRNNSRRVFACKMPLLSNCDVMIYICAFVAKRCIWCQSLPSQTVPSAPCCWMIIACHSNDIQAKSCLGKGK